MMKHLLLAASLLFSPVVLRALDLGSEYVEQMSALANNRHGGIPLKLTKGDGIFTKAMFKPPVEIVIEAKTNSTNLRISYAADQVIFNWEGNQNQLRIDGGPASGQHKLGAGGIPKNKYVTIRWVVTPKGQSIYVDDALRFEHEGDYSKINNPIGVFSKGSEVMVKSIKVKQLPAAD
jgi:hypothetical protein